MPNELPRLGGFSTIDRPPAVAACLTCGAAFTKATARFCSKCGEKKITSPVAARRSRLPPFGTVLGEGGDGSVDNKEGGVGATLHDNTRTSTLAFVPPGGAGAPRPVKGSPATPEVDVPGAKPLSPARGRAGDGRPPHVAPVPPTPLPDTGASTVEGPSLRPQHPADQTLGGDGGGSDSMDEHFMHTINPSPEEEERYSTWATLGPEGLTPEMLQTTNAEELRLWRKGCLVGRGTYGSVYLALMPDGTFYAVKCVQVGRHTAADMLHLNLKELVTLSREINLMHRLKHPNLCGFKGVCYDPDTTSICMFMEYVGGGSLSSVVKRFKPLPPLVVRRWTRQLLHGLLYLHSQYIIHRDIKGDNVLVDTSCNPQSEAQIKLVDFGAARSLADAVSQSQTVIGTPYWMAPEVVHATGENRGYSYKADVWSVGCTVAEMLTGRPPWPSRPNAPAAILMVASATGLPLEVPRAEATPGCYDFMVRCFERDPEKRPTVEELLHHPWIRGEME